MYKILSGRAPSLSSEFIVNDRRHTHKIMLPRPKLDIFKTSLMYSGGFLWNSLLSNNNVGTSLHSFKLNYHKHLMTEFVKSE